MLWTKSKQGYFAWYRSANGAFLIQEALLDGKVAMAEVSPFTMVFSLTDNCTVAEAMRLASKIKAQKDAVA